MPREKLKRQETAVRGRGRPPKTVSKPASEKLFEKPTQLKIGNAYDTHILTHPRMKSSHTVTAVPAKPGISITVQVPSLRRPKVKSPADTLLPARPLPARRVLRPLIMVPVLLVVIAGLGFGFITWHHKPKSRPAAPSAAVRTAPDYEPLLPADASTTTTEYNGQKNIVSYDTNFSGARVTVSQQPLPANFATDANALVRAANSIDATHKVDTSSGPLYTANSTNDDSQMGIYAGKNVLVFIHTDRKLDDVSWKNFIELMRAKSWQDIK